MEISLEPLLMWHRNSLEEVRIISIGMENLGSREAPKRRKQRVSVC